MVYSARQSTLLGTVFLALLPLRVSTPRITSLHATNILCSLWDFALIAAIYYIASTYIPKINPENIALPNPALYKYARGFAWAFYGFAAGLPGTGLWVIAHECGHQAFSTSKTVNNTVGWILHSA